jgi:hypothetical protein
MRMRAVALVVAFAEGAVSVCLRSLAGLPLENHQAWRIRNRQGTERHSINETEDCSICADAERQGQDCNDGK